MREIKFRAWDGTEMTYGAAIQFTEEGQLLFHSLGDSLLEGCPIDEEQGHAVMQYTGLKDKTGHHIYEGDILWNGRFNSQDGSKVVAAIKAAAWGPHRNSSQWYIGGFTLKPSPAYSISDFDGDNNEVIGNIYENPELLNP